MLYCTALNFDFLHCVLLVLCTTILYVLIFVYVRHSRSESSAKKITGSRFADDCISQFQILIQDPARIIADNFTYFNFFFILYDDSFFFNFLIIRFFAKICPDNILTSIQYLKRNNLKERKEVSQYLIFFGPVSLPFFF